MRRVDAARGVTGSDVEVATWCLVQEICHVVTREDGIRLQHVVGAEKLDCGRPHQLAHALLVDHGRGALRDIQAVTAASRRCYPGGDALHFLYNRAADLL